MRGEKAGDGVECDWEECDVSYVRNAERYYGGNALDVRAARDLALGGWWRPARLSESLFGRRLGWSRRAEA